MASDQILDRDVPPWAKDRLPVNFEAEQALLGALLINNRVYEQVTDLIQPHHFGEPLHGRIFHTIGRQIERGHEANPTTLRFYFERDEVYTEMGGDEYLVALAADTLSVVNARDYAETVVEMYRRRRVAIAGIRAYHAATEDIFEGQSADDAITVAIQELERIDTTNARLVPRSFKDILVETLELAEKARETKGESAGLLTGLHDLDSAIGGLPLGEITIMAGRPGMGKTALGGTVALNAANRSTPVGFFSLEMSGSQIANRMVSSAAHVNSNAVRRGQLTDEEYAQFRAWADSMMSLPITIDESPKQSVRQIERRARMLQRENQCDVLIVDYLGLIDVTDSRYHSRVYEIEECTKHLKALAKELNIPLILLVQIGRGVESREDKRPTMADLRDSGAIEQDAGIILLLYRHEYYLARNRPETVAGQADWEHEMALCKNKAEIIVAKNRFGPANHTIEVGFDPARATFFNLSHHSQEDINF